MATMRYIVDDVSLAADFYVGSLGFDVVERFGPAIAILRRGDVDLWLAGPTSSAARAMPDGRVPAPGGWNRLVITVEDLDAMVDRLRTTARRSATTSSRGPAVARSWSRIPPATSSRSSSRRSEQRVRERRCILADSSYPK